MTPVAVTIEMIIAVTGFTGTLIAIYINSKKAKSENQTKLATEIEWRVKTTQTLDSVLRNSEEMRLNQTKIDDLVRKNDSEIKQLKQDIKNIWDKLELIQTQINKVIEKN
jgi:hypothetical protein